MIFSFKTKKKLVQLHSFKDESQEKYDKINFIMHKKKFRLPITGKPESITLLLTTKLTAKIICKSRAKRKITANIYSKIHDFPKNQTERS